MSRVSNLVSLKIKTVIGLLYRDRLAKGLGVWVRSEKPRGYEGLGLLLWLLLGPYSAAPGLTLPESTAFYGCCLNSCP